MIMFQISKDSLKNFESEEIKYLKLIYSFKINI